MEFEIDVSGEDILSKNYTICIANKDGIIKGFKFDSHLVQVLRTKQGQGLYRYGLSKKEKRLFKIRLYCIIIHYLFKSITKVVKNLSKISLKICRDFEGYENEIKGNLKYFLENKQELDIESIIFVKLDKSDAHRYAYLTSKDRKNQMKNYVEITLEEIEKFLK